MFPDLVVAVIDALGTSLAYPVAARSKEMLPLLDRNIASGICLSFFFLRRLFISDMRFLGSM
jgi:hypothetical protein